jgi:ABC-type polysaccharide/polyol phosphate export permease
MISLFRSLWHARNLLANLVRRDLTIRYKSSILGLFWSFAKPLAYMLIYQVIFGLILKIEIRESEIPYALHVLAGVLPWTFFIGATGEAMNSILVSANLVKKVKLPLAVFPAASVCSHAIHFLLAMVVLLAFMIGFGLTPGPAFMLLPAVFLLQFVLILAVSMLLAALNVFYRDVSSIWEVAGTAWFYATPIIYPAYQALDFFASRGWQWAEYLYMANPMTPVILGYRRLTLYGAVEGSTEIPDSQLLIWLGLAGGVAIVALGAANLIFNRLARRFADEL